MSSLHPSPAVVLQQVGGAGLDPVMAIMDEAFDQRFGEAWTRAQCAGILPMHGVVLTLATNNSVPLGFSLVRSVADESELLLLAVRPHGRRRGVATALVNRFIADARGAGAHYLHLEVRDGNPATALYERTGFRIVGRRSNYYRGTDGETFDALTMARTF
ncbi:GNAT family N-acetyltransferase [Sphingomonas sp. BN140010]|uniref:GNAT family N-acetyltransferase n=1 Tax=Sphingomonas arvum TaxID=2992113 RepID=A0ABT3JHH0_9SPHN|nr:GNAT family N-acetyltransferase [Sphingomonas sp. BN140010]MCW3798522.1 GNAT family N-acetyltransferase [Sphingomonas sp. BN140010]